MACFDCDHPPIPFLQAGVRGGQLVVARNKGSWPACRRGRNRQNAARRRSRNGRSASIISKGIERAGQFREQSASVARAIGRGSRGRICAPCGAERPVARLGHQFLPINVVELEADAFDLVLDVPPENRLQRRPTARETGPDCSLASRYLAMTWESSSVSKTTVRPSGGSGTP